MGPVEVEPPLTDSSTSTRGGEKPRLPGEGCSHGAGQPGQGCLQRGTACWAGLEKQAWGPVACGGPAQASRWYPLVAWKVG